MNKLHTSPLRLTPESVKLFDADYPDLTGFVACIIKLIQILFIMNPDYIIFKVYQISVEQRNKQ